MQWWNAQTGRRKPATVVLSSLFGMAGAESISVSRTKLITPPSWQLEFVPIAPQSAGSLQVIKRPKSSDCVSLIWYFSCQGACRLHVCYLRPSQQDKSARQLSSSQQHKTMISALLEARICQRFLVCCSHSCILHDTDVVLGALECMRLCAQGLQAACPPSGSAAQTLQSHCRCEPYAGHKWCLFNRPLLGTVVLLWFVAPPVRHIPNDKAQIRHLQQSSMQLLCSATDFLRSVLCVLS